MLHQGYIFRPPDKLKVYIQFFLVILYVLVSSNTPFYFKDSVLLLLPLATTFQVDNIFCAPYKLIRIKIFKINNVFIGNNNACLCFSYLGQPIKPPYFFICQRQ